jgi:hypothetical protein
MFHTNFCLVDIRRWTTASTCWHSALFCMAPVYQPPPRSSTQCFFGMSLPRKGVLHPARPFFRPDWKIAGGLHGISGAARKTLRNGSRPASTRTRLQAVTGLYPGTRSPSRRFPAAQLEKSNVRIASMTITKFPRRNRA